MMMSVEAPLADGGFAGGATGGNAAGGAATGGLLSAGGSGLLLSIPLQYTLMTLEHFQTKPQLELITTLLNR